MKKGLIQAMNTYRELLSSIPEIEAKLGYCFQDKKLLALAFIHRSFINENRQIVSEHNERLEFLGDAILGLLISEHLYRLFPGTPEGQLSALRARLVEAQACSKYVQQLCCSEYLLLGKGELTNDGRGRESILADLFEAIIGAIFLDGGSKSAQEFLFRHFSEAIDALVSAPQANWKAELQDYAQKKFRETPFYEVVHESGPDHSKSFEIQVKISNQTLGCGQGNSKKEAQQAAARQALEKIHGR
ncbi:MAG: rnc [Chlamydiales bacterium]|nr:rnc [Chlamydiales bacterium]